MINNNYKVTCVKSNNINQMYYIPKYKLIGIVRLLNHFNLNRFKLSFNFNDEIEFWNMLYGNDMKNLNNVNKLALSCSINNILYNRNFSSIYTKKNNCYRVNSFKISIRDNFYNMITIINMYPKHCTIMIVNDNNILLRAKCKGNNLLHWNVEFDKYSIGNNILYYKLQEIVYVLTNGFQIHGIKQMGYSYYYNQFKKLKSDIIDPYILNKFLEYNYYKYECIEILEKIFKSANNKILEVNQRKQESKYICNILLIECFNIINNWYYNVNVPDIINQNRTYIQLHAPMAYGYYNKLMLEMVKNLPIPIK